MSSTRREVLRDGAALGAAGAVAGSLGVDDALAARRRRRRRGRRRVAVLGGGVAGLTVAHELALRGFSVDVYEARAFGGKARSFGVPRSASGGRRPLPAEHGARFIPGFYENLPDTMRRIPFGSDPDGTFGNVVTAPQVQYARDGGREEWNANFAPRELHPWTLAQFRQTMIASLETSLRLPPHEIAWFVERLIVFFSSCDARRMGQWEPMSWFDYVSADRFSEDYRRMLVSSWSRFILGAKADEASARTLGLMWEQMTYALMGRGRNGEFDQVLSLPTNAAWINPWLALLRRLGVRLHRGATVERLRVRGGRVVAADVRSPSGSVERVEADWFVLAVPVEKARRLLGRRRLLSLDPSFEGLRSLETRWMNGIQFYLRRPTPIVRGHVLHIDSPWALTSISQAQFWPRRDFPRYYGRGTVHECLSVDIAAFDVPGIVFGRPARDLRLKRQVAREVWEQMKAHLNDRGRVVLRDSDLVRWYLDPALVYRRAPGGGGDRRHPRNREPLFISTPGSWRYRPDARTDVPNLFLAADYVRVAIDTASMEGACAAGRKAANGVLDAADSPASAARVFGLYRPPEWEPLRRADEERWRRGRGNALDVPAPPDAGSR